MEIISLMNSNKQQQLNDDEFLQLQLVIEAKRNMLLNKQKRIKRISKQNAFLEQVKNDYEKYNNYILKQKEDQIMALNLLNNYIKDLSNSGQLSENNIKDAKREQNKIKRELKTIKSGLSNLMNDTNEINTTLEGKRMLI
jgi:hypothetical protein